MLPLTLHCVGFYTSEPTLGSSNARNLVPSPTLYLKKSSSLKAHALPPPSKIFPDAQCTWIPLSMFSQSPVWHHGRSILGLSAAPGMSELSPGRAWVWPQGVWHRRCWKHQQQTMNQTQLMAFLAHMPRIRANSSQALGTEGVPTYC